MHTHHLVPASNCAATCTTFGFHSSIWKRKIGYLLFIYLSMSSWHDFEQWNRLYQHDSTSILVKAANFPEQHSGASFRLSKESSSSPASEFRTAFVATVTRQLMQTNKRIQSQFAFAISWLIHKYIPMMNLKTLQSYHNNAPCRLDSVDSLKWDIRVNCRRRQRYSNGISMHAHKYCCLYE